MNKLTLLGIATHPKYDAINRWMGAEIFAAIEAITTEGIDWGVHRVGLRIEVSPNLALAVKTYGHSNDAAEILMKEIKSCLNACPKKWPGTERDADTIYEVIRLKMPRFVTKAVHRIYYSQNFRTGEIDECPEEMLDRVV